MASTRLAVNQDLRQLEETIRYGTVKSLLAITAADRFTAGQLKPIVERIVENAQKDLAYKTELERRNYKIENLQFALKRIRDVLATPVVPVPFEKRAAKSRQEYSMPLPDPKAGYDSLRSAVEGTEAKIKEIETLVRKGKLGRMEADEQLRGMGESIREEVREIRINQNFDPAYRKEFDGIKEIGRLRAVIWHTKPRPSGPDLLLDADRLIGRINSLQQTFAVEEGFREIGKWRR